MNTTKENAEVNENINPLNFEEAMQTLETIVHQLEAGDLPLEESLKIYEQGVKLATQCQKSLSLAEQKVAILSNIGTEKEYLESYNDGRDDEYHE